MKTAIVVTLCSRPEYTRTVLSALAKCDEVDQYPIYLACEPVCQEVVDAANTFAALPHVKATVEVHKVRYGCNFNTRDALATGFHMAEQVIALEDDTVPGRDFLRFCRWGLETYRDDKEVFSVCGYQRTPLDETGFRSAVIREPWFTPWGWATWRDRWDSIRGEWYPDHMVSWDTVIDKFTRGNRCEVRPMLARIQNIGGEGGAHVPSAEWHKAHHLNPHWIDNVKGPRVDEWCEVHPSATKAMRSAAPC